MVLSDLAGSRLYLDTNIFIYAFEAQNRWTPVLIELFRLIEAKICESVTSEMTLAELLVKPLRDGNDAMVRRYQDALSPEGMISLVPVDRAILEAAAGIRAEKRIKLFDAIHVASCASARCQYLVTHDSPMVRALPDGIVAVDIEVLRA